MSTLDIHHDAVAGSFEAQVDGGGHGADRHGLLEEAVAGERARQHEGHPRDPAVRGREHRHRHRAQAQRRQLGPAQALMELQAEHERLMQRVGLEPEGRKYTPHVTLARLRDSSSRQVADYLALRAPFRSPLFRISRFVLFSSRASVGGGPYVVEAAYPLAA